MTMQLERSTKTLTLTTAQALIHYLTQQKVELHDGSIVPLFGGIWGIYGHGNVAGVGEALWKYRHKMPYFRGQNEQGMAHAAIAYAKANRSRRVMGVTSSIGPGATNMVTAAALAHVNRLPVLFLPGDIFASRRPDPVLQQLENFQSPLTSVNDCFAPVSRYFDRITRPEQLLESLPQAMRTLLMPSERGPVTLALPQDTQTESWEFPESFFAEKIHYLERARPDSRSVERAVALLRRANRPLLIAGGGVHYSGAEGKLKQFVEKHGIPVAETQAGKTSLPWDHPLNLGAIGVTGTSAANAYARKADLIFCVGTRLSDFTTASKSLFHHANMIQVNVTPFDTVKGNGVALVADAQEGLQALCQSLGDTAWTLNLKPLKDKWEEIYQNSTQETEELPSDAQVLATVNRALDDKDIIVCAAGGLPGELHKNWRSRDPISYHLEYGYSCMGYEIAGAVGIKLAHPERKVYVLVGDGSYLMHHTELLTALQLKLKIHVILLDNRGFGCINRLQKGCGSPPFGNLFSEFPAPDFVQNAQSYGCHAEKVQSLEELESALRANRSRGESCVTVINTDPQTSSPGHAWWDVAVAETSDVLTVRQARENYEKHLEAMRERH